MLPVTHGEKFTRLHLLLYTIILVVTTLLPFASGMSGAFYLVSALALDAVFLAYAVALYRSYSDHLARKTFAYSIFYLSMLFAVGLTTITPAVHRRMKRREFRSAPRRSRRSQPATSSRSPSSMASTSPARNSVTTSRSPTTMAARFRSRISAARWWRSSSASRNARTSARRRFPTWPRR